MLCGETNLFDIITLSSSAGDLYNGRRSFTFAKDEETLVPGLIRRAEMEVKRVPNGYEFRGHAVTKVWSFLVKVPWRGAGSPRTVESESEAV